ncbi:SIR2 family protein [Ruoffia tabacinasalis]|uniref:SIR2 family protein n=1 Tax=Ruoffia tabacinasalis TaxID=87458 RepID=A0ABS0LPF6_9LACT|nr:SIR2 family protein [Ruoffia tabacinasalis]MBG9979304.1 SIR2 family protein [Ruoffia tabacinasalis]
MGEPIEAIINEKENYQKVYKNYKEFVELLLKILHSESNERPKRINIFTTNYDLLFENAFDSINDPLSFFNDGSKGFIKRKISNKNFFLNVTQSGYGDKYKREIPTINLFKMHGSLSWERESSNKDLIVNYDSTHINKLTNILIGDDTELTEENVKSLFELNVVIEDYEGEEDMIYEYINNYLNGIVISNTILEHFENEYEKILIINPDKRKFRDTVLDEHYFQQIRSLSYELEKDNSVLIVFGFSFADEHIQSIFERSLLNPSLDVYIIYYSEDTLHELKNIKFVNYKNIRYLPPNNKLEDGEILKGNFDYLMNLLGGKSNVE